MYKRLIIYQKISIYFFVANMGFYILNDSVLKKTVPIEVVGYSLFLSLGFFVGVNICIDALRKESKLSKRNFNQNTEN
jgi:hypothetical protein